MKYMNTLLLTAAMVLAVAAAKSQMTVTPGDGGKTVIETVTTPTYGTVRLTWAADANIAGGMLPGSPYWVPGINPDGSMPLSVASAFAGNGCGAWRCTKPHFRPNQKRTQKRSRSQYCFR